MGNFFSPFIFILFILRLDPKSH